MALRPAIADDRDAVLALGVAEEAAWFGAAEVSLAEVAEWIDDEGGIGRGAVSVDGRAGVRGFASPGEREAVFLSDPPSTDETADELLPWLCTQRDVVELMTFAGDAVRLAAFERHGLRHVRSSFSLARPVEALPAAAPPDGVDLAPYRVGDDDEAVHRLIYVDAAWASVPGHALRNFDEWRERIGLCCSLFLTRRNGRPIGWVAGRLLDSGRGFVTSLAVATDERGRGLGRALLVRAFEDLELAGATDLGLGVEAHNEAALRLYRSVGLEVEREWRIYATSSKRPDRA